MKVEARKSEKVYDVLLDELLESEETASAVSLSPPMALWSDRQHSHLLFNQGTHTRKVSLFLSSLRHAENGQTSRPMFPIFNSVSFKKKNQSVKFVGYPSFSLENPKSQRERKR